jgi:hypothetical protein
VKRGSGKKHPRIVSEAEWLALGKEDIQPDMAKGFSAGSRKVLSSLKSLFETGRGLPVWAPAREAT